MRTFDLLTPANAMAKLNAALDAARVTPPTETVSTAAARDRVLARDVVSPIPLPEFRRSTVDGYAVKAGSTPGVLRVVGEVRMGELTDLHVKLGDAALVHTGGNIPAGADTVVMMEQVRFLDSSGLGKIQTQAQMSSGENIIREGEDVQPGEVVIHAGTRLREQEIGGLLSLGHDRDRGGAPATRRVDRQWRRSGTPGRALAAGAGAQHQHADVAGSAGA